MPLDKLIVCLALGLALTGPAEAQKRTKYAVTVTLAGTGTGTVTSSPAGISCPGTCSFQFNSGTDVVLTATPASGSTFSGWTGDCAGTSNCSLPLLVSAKSVTATFASSGGGGVPPSITEIYLDLLDGPTGSITILGENFDASTVIRLASIPLNKIGSTDTALTVALPNMLPSGDYLITLTNSAGSTSWSWTYIRQDISSMAIIVKDANGATIGPYVRSDDFVHYVWIITESLRFLVPIEQRGFLGNTEWIAFESTDCTGVAYVNTTNPPELLTVGRVMYPQNYSGGYPYGGTQVYVPRGPAVNIYERSRLDYTGRCTSQPPALRSYMPTSDFNLQSLGLVPPFSGY